MKYFTKYLPLEGEINLEDSYLLRVDSSIQKGDFILKNDGSTRSKLDMLCKGSILKVKLFLCSRDIQVGDKIWHTSLKEQDICEDIVEEAIHIKSDREGHYSSMNQWFKVLGEISSGAIWVKEGDEFEEDQIRITSARFSHSDPRRGDIVHTKCPTCNTFH